MVLCSTSFLCGLQVVEKLLGTIGRKLQVMTLLLYRLACLWHVSHLLCSYHARLGHAKS